MAEEQYRVYASLTPVIPSGDTAEIAVNQTLTGNGALLHTSGPTVKVSVRGPQTAITEDDISGVYPAPGSNDSPDEFLPHIALSRRTLPWERRGPADGTPWLALLVVTQADLTVRTGPVFVGGVGAVAETPAAPVAKSVPAQPVPAVPAKNVVVTNEAVAKQLASAAAVGSESVIARPIGLTQTGSMTPKSVTVSQLASTDAATRTQLLTIPGITDNTQIQTIAIPAVTLKEILPVAQDLKYFVNVKEVIQGASDVFTAIVMSARLPNSNANPATHAAYLVSLEHRDDIYTRWDKGGWINLIVLHSWTFVPSKGGDFEQVCSRIRYRPNGGVLRFGNLPANSPDSTKSITPFFDCLVDKSGYLLQPLDHVEAGNVTWRSPLRPFPPPPRAVNTFAVRSDPEEFAGAPAGSPLDYSHATAFELGKLLALADIGIREDLRDIHEIFNIPTNFVAMSNLPPVLQMPLWGIDQGESLDQAQQTLNQGMQNPWSMANSQSMVGVQNALGNGQVAGMSAKNVAAQLTTVANAVNAAITASVATPGQNTPIDIGSVTEGELVVEFPDLVNAGLAGGV